MKLKGLFVLSAMLNIIAVILLGTSFVILMGFLVGHWEVEYSSRAVVGFITSGLSWVIGLIVSGEYDTATRDPR